LLRTSEVPRWAGALLIDPLAVTVAAVIATAPLLALDFGRLSLVAVPANLVIVPAFPLMLLASLIAALGGLLPFGHLVAGAPAYALLRYWLLVAGWLGSQPGAAAGAGGYSRTWLIGTYLALAAIAVIFAPWLRRVAVAELAPSEPFRWRTARRRGAYLLPGALLLVGLGWVARGSGDQWLEVTVLDVGQGDAILIEAPGGQDVLVDGGPGDAVLRGLGRELAWNDRSIDLVVMTHAQADHGTGLIDVLARYDVRAVMMPATSGDSLVGAAVREAAEKEGSEMTVAKAGRAFELGNGVTLEVLWPKDGLDGGTSVNNAATVMRLSWGDVSFLLTSDIEAATERVLVEDGAELNATVLKVAHHGSATSSTPAFVQAVSPEVNVVSSGTDNRYRHPDAEVVDRLDDYGAVYNTAISGAVHIETDGHRLWIDTQR
jgi:competence protein ComEC